MLNDDFLIKVNGGKDLHDCPSYVGPHPGNVNEIIPVCFYGRSGTTFFMSLLDGHPEIITAGDCEFREYFKRFDFIVGNGVVQNQLRNALLHYARNLEYEGKNCNNYVEIGGRRIHIPATLCFANEKPENGELFYIPPKEDDEYKYQGPYIGYFISIFLKMVERFFGDVNKVSLSEKDFFVIFILAYNWSIGRQYSESASKIAWNMHIPCSTVARNAQSKFPKITLIHMIRKPLQSLGSHFKRYMNPTKGMEPNIPVHAYVVKLFAEQLNGDTPLIECRPADDEFAIRLEDIHSSPRETLGNIAGRLGVAWSGSLLESAFFGKVLEWKGSSYRQTIVGFSTEHLKDDHPDIFSAEDARFIESLFYDNYKKWGYKLSNDITYEESRDYVSKRIPVPMKMEVLCWEKSCQEGVSRVEVVKSYNLLRDALEKRIIDGGELLELM